MQAPLLLLPVSNLVYSRVVPTVGNTRTRTYFKQLRNNTPWLYIPKAGPCRTEHPLLAYILCINWVLVFFQMACKFSLVVFHSKKKRQLDDNILILQKGVRANAFTSDMWKWVVMRDGCYTRIIKPLKLYNTEPTGERGTRTPVHIGHPDDHDRERSKRCGSGRC